MIRNRDLKSNIFYILLGAVFAHAAVLAFVKIELHTSEMLEGLTGNSKIHTRPIKLDKIDFINKAELEKMKRVGIKNGKKEISIKTK